MFFFSKKFNARSSGCLDQMLNHLNLIELIFLKIEQKFKKIILSVFELFLSFSNKCRDFLKNWKKNF